ncbi:hypothetical protein BYT27DRAFT_7336497 [Phlegmacium glaucopus]|nr:hypothetical protein BYT27DRAFT_7336497 [Phlegmacium glaucopus]
MAAVGPRTFPIVGDATWLEVGRISRLVQPLLSIHHAIQPVLCSRTCNTLPRLAVQLIVKLVIWLYLGTSESIAISGKGRFGGLKIKSHEESNVIHVVVESPIENSFMEEQDVIAEVTLDGNQGATAPISGNE